MHSADRSCGGGSVGRAPSMEATDRPARAGAPRGAPPAASARQPRGGSRAAPGPASLRGFWPVFRRQLRRADRDAAAGRGPALQRRRRLLGVLQPDKGTAGVPAPRRRRPALRQRAAGRRAAHADLRPAQPAPRRRRGRGEPAARCAGGLAESDVEPRAAGACGASDWRHAEIAGKE